MTAVTLTEFLLARIAEDEEAARDAAGWDASGRERATGRWLHTGISSIEDDERRSVVYSDNNQLNGAVADHIARHDPARVLAECEAKRRIVERCAHVLGAFANPYDSVTGQGGAWSDVNRREKAHAVNALRDLALPYADRPDYRDEWRP